ncbi:MAG: Gfo/Idh/MocA family oxidoreductase [Pirellulales bacterium]|nr:Gfo/Idh/MocA family oxidoreductase [Pirellulales bacterium]
MLRIGIAGIGFMGMIHYLSYAKVRGAKVVALAEPDAKRRAGDWRGIQGNFGPAGTQMDLKGVRTYATFEELAADPDLDVIDVCLPPALHPAATVAAFGGGKAVFCEKPIALSTAAAQKMVAAGERAQRPLMIGHVLPFFPEYAFAYKAVTSGKYGRLLGGHFKRVISDPLWLRDFWDPKKVGGPVLDLHIHDAHFIRLLCGMPTSVTSNGRMRGECVEFLSSQFQFADRDLAVTATSGVINQQGRGFTHGFEIHLQRATLLFDLAMYAGGNIATPLTVLTKDGKVLRPELGGGDPMDGFAAELTEVVRALRSGKPSPILSGDLARDALVMCQKESQSVRTGKPVKIG